MNKIKRIIAMILSVVLIALSLNACKIEQVANNDTVLSAKELMQKYVDNSKKNNTAGDYYNYGWTKRVKEWLFDTKASTNLINVDLDVPYDFSASFGAFNGKLTLTSNVTLQNIGKKNSSKLGSHNLFKIKCDYKYSLGGNVFPSVISFDGNVVCYIAFSEENDTIRGYYRLNDFDKNWYTFKITDVENGIKYFEEMETNGQKDLEKRKKMALEDETTDEKTKKYYENIDTDISKKTKELIDYYFNAIVESSTMVNTSASIDEINIKDAYEVKSEINLVNDYLLNFIEEYVPESDKESFKELGLDQLKDKLIIQINTFFVKGEKSPINFDDYSVVKTTTDLKGFLIDYSHDDIKVKVNFDKGKFDNIMKNGSEPDNISDEIIENAKTVWETKLSEAAGVASF